MNSDKSNAIVGAGLVEENDPEHHRQHVIDNMHVIDDNAIINGDVDNHVDVSDVHIDKGRVRDGNDVHYFANAFLPRQRGPDYAEWKRRLEDIRTRDATYEEMLSQIIESQRRKLFRDHFRRVRQRKQEKSIIGSILEFDPATVETQRRELLRDNFRPVRKTKQNVDEDVTTISS